MKFLVIFVIASIIVQVRSNEETGRWKWPRSNDTLDRLVSDEDAFRFSILANAISNLVKQAVHVEIMGIFSNKINRRYYLKTMLQNLRYPSKEKIVAFFNQGFKASNGYSIQISQDFYLNFMRQVAKSLTDKEFRKFMFHLGLFPDPVINALLRKDMMNNCTRAELPQQS